ncbi:MAG TPA: hypothetical protein VMI55_00770 [Thermoplasmata archaeon]|nr:hypothetical protein [Thermoplasmata archaeon]
MLQKEAEEGVAQLDRLGISIPDTAERVQQLKELARRSDWDAVETQAKSLIDYIASRVTGAIQDRRRLTVEAVPRLEAAGVTVPASLKADLEALSQPGAAASWSDTVARLARIEDALSQLGLTTVTHARDQALAVADWAHVPPERRTEFASQLDAALAPAREGRVAEALTAVAAVLKDQLPEAKQLRETARARAEARAALAKEHGTPTSEVDSALRADQSAPPERWPVTVPAIDRAAAELSEVLRAWTTQTLTTLRSSLDGLAEYGSDPSEARVVVEEAIARLPTVPPDDLGPLLDRARQAAEEPIVAVVAGLLDEVRPRINEIRRLGRDPSEVFAAMNRAREALRLKIYSEALAASQEAVERVGQLTEDLEVARDELNALDEMLSRFKKSGFAREEFDPSLAKARAQLERAEVAPARAELRDALLRIGREALRYLSDRWTALDRVREYAHEHGFLSPEAEKSLADSRARLDAGELAAGAELLAQAEVELRASAGPYVSRRVAEMEQGLSDIPDEALTAPVRRLLADADVTLRVKQDLVGASESLRKAERDFASVFAVHASALVDLLEEERRVLESMGGAGDEIQRQIDEVQQIFNMGDFVKASRASQEIRTRAQQQQLLRSEEAVSHAKLSLVELETLGLDLGRFRGDLEEAQAAARAGHYAEAHRLAKSLEETAVRTRADTQAVVDDIAQAQEALGDLREMGVDPEPFYEPIRAARLAFQALDLGAARETIAALRQRLTEATAAAETDRLFGEIDRLIEDGRRVAAPMEAYASRLQRLRTERTTAAPEATRTATRALHEELVALLVPILEENLRGLERDLDIARGAGVDLDKIVAPLSEARRRISLPVPVGAAALLDAARSEFVGTRGLVEHAERVSKRAREALAQADLLRVEPGTLRSQMDQVDAALAKREYARAIELGGPLEREVLQATYHQVSKTLAGFRATVTRLRSEGIDTTVAENLLHQARMALDEGRPVDAVQLASKSEAELERVDLQRRIAEGSIEATAHALERAQAEGVVAPSVTNSLEAARILLQKHDYPAVLEHAIDASDTLVALRESHRRAAEAYASAQAQIAETSELGADATDSRARLADALRFIETGQYPDGVRAAREATELGRWAIERLFAGPLGQLRRLVEVGRQEGLTTEVEPIESIVTEAEAALRARDWAHVREAVARAAHASEKALSAVIDARWADVQNLVARLGPASESERARATELRDRLADLQVQRNFVGALALVREERSRAVQRRREAVEAELKNLKDQLWIGERLGVDTTPMMQTFSEARVALDATHLDEAETLFARAREALEHAIDEPFGRRRGELLAEINFAADGLRVSVGPLRVRYVEMERLATQRRLLDGARMLIAVEEDLNLRKSLHRELMNLHYLIDAALARAAERRVDTSEARALLAESVRLRDDDYSAALEKARDALRRLQGEAPSAATTAPAATATGSTRTESAATTSESSSTSSSPPPSTPFWPFRRSPPT